jgi:outer membrane cobalamin receptor
VNLLARMTPLAETETNNEGKYRFENLSGGSYQILATAPGLASTTEAIELQSGGSITKDLHVALTSATQSVVVSASLGGSLATQVGSTVSVLSDDEIREKGAQNILEVLREVPGLAVTQSGRPGRAAGL